MVDDALRALERSAAQGDPAAKEKLERLRVRAGVHESSDDVTTALAALEAQDVAAEGQHRERGIAAFQGWLEAVFAAEPGLHVAIVQGFTPSFNDGDPCTHSQWAIFSGTAPGSPAPFWSKTGWLGRPAPVNTLTADQALPYERAADQFRLPLELTHGTNWRLTIRRAPTGVSIERADVDSEEG